MMSKKGILGFRQMLEACRNSKFVALELRENVLDEFKLSPIGRMLQNNLKDEFRRGEAGTAVYEGSSGITLKENLSFVRETFNPNVPFGIAIEERFSNERVALNDSFSLNLEQGHMLSCQYLVNPSTSTEFMYKIQRQRKIWWMRYACDPGRFFISDPRQDSTSRVQSVSIRSRLGGEELTLENLQLIPSEAVGDEELGDFRIKAGRTNSRKIRPCVLRVRQCVEVATLQVLLDAFESEEGTVRIHRKLAPYKCGIVCHAEDPAQLTELRDLAKHLCNVLRKANLPVLDCSDRNGNRKQFHHLDSIAVPYSLVLRDQTLQTGLLQLRSRDTTLSETIHISDLPQYLLKIVTS